MKYKELFEVKTQLLNTDFDRNSEDLRELMDGEFWKSTDNNSAEVKRVTMAFSCSLHVTVLDTLEEVSCFF